MPDCRFDATSRFVDLSGGRLHYHEAGEGPCLLLLRGSGPGVRGWANFEKNRPVFAESFRCLIIDFPGYGDSDAVAGDPMSTCAGFGWDGAGMRSARRGAESAPQREPNKTRGWAFEDFVLREDLGLLRTDGMEVALAPMPLAMLVHLVRARDRVVSREELLEALGPSVSVSRSAFESVLQDMRRALGDTATESRFIATLRRRDHTPMSSQERLPGHGTTTRWIDSVPSKYALNRIFANLVAEFHQRDSDSRVPPIGSFRGPFLR